MVWFKTACFLIVFFMFLPGEASGENGCVQCHQAVKGAALKAFFQEWKESVHSQKGITCEYCHGGDADKKSKDEAHRGVHHSMDPESSVYYTRIPSLCGTCHKAEFNEFTTSLHYRELMSRGVGPNCATCHDAMSTKIVKAKDMELFCAVCHNSALNLSAEPTSRSQSLMEYMERVGQKIEDVQGRLAQRSTAEISDGKAEGFLNLARQEFFACKQEWHAFELKRVASRLKGVEQLIQNALQALGPPREGG